QNRFRFTRADTVSPCPDAPDSSSAAMCTNAGALSPRAFFAEGMNHHPTLKLPPLQDIEYGLRSLLRPSVCVARSGVRKKPAWVYCNNGNARQTRVVRETLSKHILRRLRDPVAIGDPAGVQIPCRNLRSRPEARCYVYN